MYFYLLHEVFTVEINLRCHLTSYSDEERERSVFVYIPSTYQHQGPQFLHSRELKVIIQAC
jgi:hypothetical protein